MFVQSLHGISHNKIEDTKEEHLALAVTAFDKLPRRPSPGSPPLKMRQPKFSAGFRDREAFWE
jgi:hypothetical protein